MGIMSLDLSILNNLSPSPEVILPVCRSSPLNALIATTCPLFIGTSPTSISHPRKIPGNVFVCIFGLSNPLSLFGTNSMVLPKGITSVRHSSP
jgi:hypothetical protein